MGSNPHHFASKGPTISVTLRKNWNVVKSSKAPVRASQPTFRARPLSLATRSAAWRARSIPGLPIKPDGLGATKGASFRRRPVTSLNTGSKPAINVTLEATRPDHGFGASPNRLTIQSAATPIQSSRRAGPQACAPRVGAMMTRDGSLRPGEGAGTYVATCERLVVSMRWSWRSRKMHAPQAAK